MKKKDGTEQAHPTRKPIDCEQVRFLAGIGCLEKEIASFFGMTRQRFHARKKANPEIQRALELGWDDEKISIRRALHKSIQNGSRACIIFACKSILGYVETAPVATERQRLEDMSDSELLDLLGSDVDKMLEGKDPLPDDAT